MLQLLRYFIRKFFISARRKILSTENTRRKVMAGQIPFAGPKAEKNREIWSNLPDNKIKEYLEGRKRSEYLHRLIVENCQSVKNNDSILEIGTNVGRNLNCIYENGFLNLHGIEINKQAVELMKKYYQNLQVNMLVGPVENKIKQIKNKQMSLTFSMAVLMLLRITSLQLKKNMSMILQVCSHVIIKKYLPN